MDREILKLLSKFDKINKSAEEILEMSVTELREKIKETGLNPDDTKSKELIESYTKTEIIGKEIYYYDSIKSTNLVGKFIAPSVSHGSVVVSKTQTMGKGRSGKKYESPEGGIWFSIILKPEIPPQKAPILTLATAVAVTRALEKSDIKSEIKWPNDILINDKKVCGVLTESIAKLNELECIIIGVGINSNNDVNEFPPELIENSIALKDVSNKEINNEKEIGLILEEFDKIYKEFVEDNTDEIFDEWRKYSHTIGKMVEIRQPLGKNIVGYAVGINKEGALILEDTNGKLVKILSGECKLLH